ncbi:SDR family NAD(P)-dependent oxidoreductase [Lichenifustis flavocetrariae]|uniref:SDR family NAD(P)-dependent oxidoreductase n=1 Tax=Lichenifustis flavocetrariae TaxID=2949735 RepID=A0AA41YVK1_9HYPH|nr:SDR family NAD(P)-dependent oxidoreductase [Lichenifustis flavocetrariae]MCW6507927.1 SDR family NAD(P)-dependent oxidoreductase [Lichenifustis flavocetrariae]
MSPLPYKTALIVGAGPGISASLARALSTAGLGVGLAARNPDKLKGLAADIGARTFAADAADPSSVAELFQAVDTQLGEPDLVIFNPSQRVPGPLAELDPDQVRSALLTTAFGGFLVAQQAAQRMIPKGSGAILFTGATASLKGFARSAAFAMGKFGLRGLAQSTARELGPKGIHVVHLVVDGAVRSATRADPADKPDSTLDPDAIATTCMAVLSQPRSAWSFEVEVRPWVETF